ncbi:UDP-N-acetylmuramoyl-L-alanine--D-glutamate ligase [Permianibacter fluminis]|uniref:UDP-N-acetylmuramoyl-L-alanine--D-glutamate ligase n=1 Tax=Permianibacter fluminis TaxID=2738515 RepID=UPI001B7D7E9D
MVDARRFHVIAGLGKTGISVARYLRSRGVAFAVTDTRAQPPGVDQLREIAPDAECKFGALDAELLAKAEVIVLSPGLALAEPAIAAARSRGAQVIGDIELFVQVARAPIIAITGSNGKSTVTMLTGHLLNQAGKRALVGGNIGTPVLDLLEQPVPDYYVLELSSFQLETTYGLRAAAATVLNISEDHMDRYASLTAYAEAKARIYHHANVAVFNADDRETRRDFDRAHRHVAFAIHHSNAEYRVEHLNGRRWLTVGEQAFADLEHLPIQGEHNAANVLAAVALCEAVGVKAEKMRDGLRSFKGLPHRCVLVREHASVRYYNDSKATNVGAALAAISGIGPVITGKLVMIAGGDAKGQDLLPLTSALAHYARAVVLLGRDAERVSAVVPDSVTQEFVDSIEEAVTAAAALAEPGDAVLLSPACASLDMFRNYEERGDRFARAVELLP